MPNSVTVKLEGMDEVQEKLQSVPQKVARRWMREALNPAVRIWREEMFTLARKLTGWMASQLTIRVSVPPSDGEHGRARVTVAARQDPTRTSGQGTRGRYGREEHVPSALNEALWNEFGTIKMPARPFIRPAFESKKQAVLDKLIERLRSILTEEAS